MLSFIKKMTSLIVTNFSQKLSDLKNFNFEVILRYYNLDLDNNLYFQNFHRKTKNFNARILNITKLKTCNRIYMSLDQYKSMGRPTIYCNALNLH